MKRRPIMPTAYEQLTDSQKEGTEYITEDLPEVFWVAELAGYPSTAHTLPIRRMPPTHLSPRSKHNEHWSMICTWWRLARQGFIPTSRENYDATRRRMYRVTLPECQEHACAELATRQK